jgi:hypothetical protein
MAWQEKVVPVCLVYLQHTNLMTGQQIGESLEVKVAMDVFDICFVEELKKAIYITLQVEDTYCEVCEYLCEEEEA